MDSKPQPASVIKPTGDRIFPRLEPTRKNPEIQAVLSKLVSSNNNSMNGTPTRGNRPLQAPDAMLLQRISDVTTGNVNDAASILQLLPDLELAMQILVSSILSPKDMVTSELTYYVEPGQFHNELAGALVDKVRDYFENTYKINEILPKILQDVLFMKGAYPMLILPETSLDDAINSPARVSMEAMRDEFDSNMERVRPIGILGSANRDSTSTPSFEQMFNTRVDTRNLGRNYSPKVEPFKKGSQTFDPKLEITDNPNVLKLPLLSDKIRQDKIQDVLAARHLSMEARRSTVSFENENGQKMEGEQSLYRRRRYKCFPVMAMVPGSAAKRKNVGHPLVMTLPTECVIPVHVPSNPEEHLGYFILLDMQGNPLVKANETDYYTDMATNMSANREMVSQFIQTTKQNTYGRNDFSVRQAEIDEMERIYGNLVEEELQNRLKSGIYGDGAQVARPEEVYRIMLARALAKMSTQILYVPAEMMTYIAFDYNKYGVGVSLLQSSKIIGGIRAMMLFANTMASIKNSVGRTLLNIQLTPEDPDPTTTVEFLMHEYARTRQGTYPLGASSPLDIISFLQNAAIEVAVSGNAAYPETKLEVEDKQSNRAKPDPELEKSLKDRHYQAIGLSPETVDAGANAEFATTIVSNNLLLTKRVLLYQNLLVSSLEEFTQKYTLSSGALMDELRDVLRENIDKLDKEQVKTKQAAEANKTTVPQSTDSASTEPPKAIDEAGLDAIIMDFIQAVRVKLPSPDTATLENQMKAFDQYVEALDKAIKAYLDADFLQDMEMGEVNEILPATIAAVRAYYIRQWLRSNNVMSELDDLTTFSDEDGPALNLLEAHRNHLEGLQKSVADYMQKLLKARKKSDETARSAKDEVTGGTEPEATGGDLGGSETAETGGEETDLGEDLNIDADIDEIEKSGEETDTAGEEEKEEDKPEEAEESSKGEKTDLTSKETESKKPEA